MQKLKNGTLQKFLEKLIKKLKDENELRKIKGKIKLDIPFIISTLYQKFQNNTKEYRMFIDDLIKYPDYSIVVLDNQTDWDGLIDVDINLTKYKMGLDDLMDFDSPDYDYKICFTIQERDWKYCECTPDMPDYREDKGCCGHGCDSSFCEFSLYRILHIISGSWDGDEYDYWNFEDEFYISDKELAKKKEKEDRERQIEELRNRIEMDQKRLAKLEEE